MVSSNSNENDVSHVFRKGHSSESNDSKQSDQKSQDIITFKNKKFVIIKSTAASSKKRIDKTQLTSFLDGLK